MLLVLCLIYLNFLLCSTHGAVGPGDAVPHLLALSAKQNWRVHPGHARGLQPRLRRRRRCRGTGERRARLSGTGAIQLLPHDEPLLEAGRAQGLGSTEHGNRDGGSGTEATAADSNSEVQYCELIFSVAALYATESETLIFD